MRNIRQVSDNNHSDFGTEIIQNIFIAPDVYVDIKYVVVSPSTENINIVKLGYCCGDADIQYPIVILPEDGADARDNLYYPGKHGMYEYQQEEEKTNGDYKYSINSFYQVQLPLEVTYPNGSVIPITFTFEQIEDA